MRIVSALCALFNARSAGYPYPWGSSILKYPYSWGSSTLEYPHSWGSSIPEYPYSWASPKLWHSLNENALWQLGLAIEKGEVEASFNLSKMFSLAVVASLDILCIRNGCFIGLPPAALIAHQWEWSRMPNADHAEFILLCKPFCYCGKLFCVIAMISGVLRRICCRSAVDGAFLWYRLKLLGKHDETQWGEQWSNRL